MTDSGLKILPAKDPSDRHQLIMCSLVFSAAAMIVCHYYQQSVSSISKGTAMETFDKKKQENAPDW